MTIILLLIFVAYILLFSICIETIGRREDIKEVEQYFNSITKEITYIYKTASEGILHDYLSDLVIHPYAKYVVCYKNGDPEILYTNEEHIDFKRLDISDKPKIDVNMKNILLEGYISLEDNAGKHNKNLYLGLFKDRNYSLLSDTIRKILFSNTIIISLIILLINWIVHRKMYKPLREINEFVDDLVIGEVPKDLKIDSLEMQGIVKSLYEIRQQLQDIKNTTETVYEEVVIDILDIGEEVIKKCSKHSEVCINITEIICKKVTRAVSCSLWLGRFSEDTKEFKVYRRAIYYEDWFPIKALAPIAEALTKEVMQCGEAKIIRDFEANAKYKDFKEARPLAVIVIPIQVKGEIVGSLCIWESRIPYSEVFDLRTRQLINYAGKIAGNIMECFDLYT